MACLGPNLNHETKQKKQEHNPCETKIQQDFIARNKQKQNKAMRRNVHKIGVEHIKSN